MRNPVLREHRVAVVGLAAAALLAGSSQLALADDGATATPRGGTATQAQKAAKAPKADGAKALCKRVPKIEARISRALKRLDGGVTVRGSVARMEKRVGNAKTAGHTEIATFLNHKLATRTAMVKTLQQRQTDVKGVKTWCQKNDNGKKPARNSAS